jgi:L-amino acid N-acyltransferase YncA
MSATITEIRPDDWPAVRAIYLQGIATGQATFQTEAPDWNEWNSGHLSACRLVLRVSGEVAAWAALSPVSRRPVYGGVAEESIYVAASQRGYGHGKRLLEELVACSERNGIWTLQAGIFPENRTSIRLHEACGFRVVGTRERLGCMNGVWRDVVLMERRSRVVGAEGS